MPDAFPPPDGFRLSPSDIVRGGEGVPARVVHPDPALTETFEPEAPMPAGWYQFELAFAPEGLVDVVVQFTFADENVLWLRLPVIARNHFLAHVRLEDALRRMTLTVTGSGRLSAPTLCRFARIGMGGQLAAAARRGVDIFRRDGLGVVWSGLNYLWRLTRPGSIAISRGSAAAKGEAPYEAWIRIFDEAAGTRPRASRRAAGIACAAAADLDPRCASVVRCAGCPRARRRGTNLSRLGTGRGDACRHSGQGWRRARGARCGHRETADRERGRRRPQRRARGGARRIRSAASPPMSRCAPTPCSNSP